VERWGENYPFSLPMLWKRCDELKTRAKIKNMRKKSKAEKIKEAGEKRGKTGKERGWKDGETPIYSLYQCFGRDVMN
jgi:hypothetical protein